MLAVHPRPHGARRAILDQKVFPPKADPDVPICPKDYRDKLVGTIHAPARGATCLQCKSSRTISRFNPRARTGRDG